jgi:hypothetical protein
LAAQNAMNQQLLEAVNATGRIFLSHTVLRRQFVLRLAIGNIRSDEQYVDMAWELLNEKLDELKSGRDVDR